MNQRAKRSRDRKRDQNVDNVVMHTGGYTAAYSRKQEPKVNVPKKATGDVPAETAGGFAKASPKFQPLKPVTPPSKTEEKKVIAEATKTPTKRVKKEDEDTSDSSN